MNNVYCLIKMGKQKGVSLHTKLKIIQDLEQNFPRTEIKQKYGVSASTISIIWSNRTAIRQSINANFASNLKIKNRRRAANVKMEEALVIFIRQIRAANKPVNRAIINAKAKEFATNFGASEFCQGS
jgi:CENP-B N-terminal DNA-binding domain/Tc5 transposase DNA-binding domain